MGEIRQPVKKEAIEKKNKIIQKGFELMCDKGYHKVNCVDIAKYADVSTGIIYQYFENKKDIFKEGVKEYYNNIMFPMLNVLSTQKIKKEELNQIFSQMIDNSVMAHEKTKKAHEELVAMSHLDEEINELSKKSEMEMTLKIVDLLQENDIDVPSIKEKVHIIISLIDNFSHEVIYHRHEGFNYEIMKDEIVNIILQLLK